MKTQQIKSVRQEVKTLDRRVDDALAIQRFIYVHDQKLLRDAERLRQLAVAHANARERGHREIRGGERLEKFAKSLSPFFVKPREPKPPLMRKWDRESKAKTKRR